MNSFLVAFESFCHGNTSNNDSDRGGEVSTLSGPLLYSDERRSVVSSGLLERIIGSDSEYMYHHCNARHLLRY